MARGALVVGIANDSSIAAGCATAFKAAGVTDVPPITGQDAELAAAFKDVAAELTENEQTIAQELLSVQGSPADIGGYYRPEDEKAFAVMRPSATLNEAIDSLKK